MTNQYNVMEELASALQSMGKERYVEHLKPAKAFYSESFYIPFIITSLTLLHCPYALTSFHFNPLDKHRQG